LFKKNWRRKETTQEYIEHFKKSWLVIVLFGAFIGQYQYILRICIDFSICGSLIALRNIEDIENVGSKQVL